MKVIQNSANSSNFSIRVNWINRINVEIEWKIFELFTLRSTPEFGILAAFSESSFSQSLIQFVQTKVNLDYSRYWLFDRCWLTTSGCYRVCSLTYGVTMYGVDGFDSLKKIQKDPSEEAHRSLKIGNYKFEFRSWKEFELFRQLMNCIELYWPNPSSPECKCWLQLAPWLFTFSFLVIRWKCKKLAKSLEDSEFSEFNSLNVRSQREPTNLFLPFFR